MAKEPRRWLVLKDPDFERVWQRLQGGDQDAWHDLVCDMLPLVNRWSRAGGMTESDAPDVVQNVLLAVDEAVTKPGHAPPRSFIGWLRQVTHNKIADWCRTRPPEKLGLDPLGTPAAPRGKLDSGRPSPKVRRLRKVIRQVRPLFSERTWQAFWLTVAEGRPIKEVAAELGMSPNAVSLAGGRVRKCLRQACIECSSDTDAPPDDLPER